MIAREAMMKAMQSGKPMTGVRGSLLTGTHEESCRQQLVKLYRAGAVSRRILRDGRAGYPAWEYYIEDAKPACCPHCGGEL